MATATCSWLNTEFQICIPDGQWTTSPGVYIFTGLNFQRQWIPLYVGQTDSFAVRLANHERWDEARQLGATHVHALVVESEAIRGSLERQLIVALQPPLNVQLRS